MNCRMRGSAFVSAVPQQWSGCAALLRRFVILVAIFSATALVASPQSTPYGGATETSQSVPSDQPDEYKDPSSPSMLTPLRSQTVDAPYHPMTSRQSLRWFITNTIGLSHLAGGIVLAGSGTVFDRPKEYGPHWRGFADRYVMRKLASPREMQLKRARASSSEKTRAIFACRAGPSRLASEMWYDSHLRPEAATAALGPLMCVTRRFSGVASSQTVGAFTARPIRTTRSCAPRKALPDAWRPMLSLNFGPTSSGVSSTNATNTCYCGEVPPQRARCARTPHYF
jgi:hypothetical protein